MGWEMTTSDQEPPQKNSRTEFKAERDLEVNIAGDMVSGDKHITIHQAPTRELTPAERQAHQVRHNLIHNVTETWIHGFLYASLHTAVMLELDKSYQRDAVTRMWGLRDVHNAEAVPENKTLLSLFEEAQHKLLILGEPGSGKTITLLQLAQELLIQAQNDPAAPVPVVLNLSSWQEKGQGLLPWLVDELNLQTGLAEQLSTDWLKVGQLILLLDGLDEVAEIHRESCVTAINDFTKQFQIQLAVCSRLTDYETLTDKLRLQNAIKIEPLGREKIDTYLAAHDPELEALRTVLPRDPVLLELAQTPLMLSVMTIAYRGLTTAELDTRLDTAARRHQLYATYIAAMFGRRPLTDTNGYDQTQALTWLTNLAHGMTTHNQQLFYIERLQPTWLSEQAKNRYKWLQSLIIGLVSALIIGLAAALVIGLSGGLYVEFFNGSSYHIQNALTFGVSFGLVFGLLLGLGSRRIAPDKIEPLETLTWLPLTRARITQALRSALIFSLPVLLLSWLLTPDKPAKIIGAGLTFALMGGLMGGRLLKEWALLFGRATTFEKYQGLFDMIIAPAPPPPSSQPNQGILASIQNSRLFGSVVGLILGPVIGIALAIAADGLNVGVAYTILSGGLCGLVIGLFTGMIYYGGLVTLQHYLLRWRLGAYDILPSLSRSWRYPDQKLIHFLDAMSDRIILRRIGGGWMFIHRTLLEYFAAQHPDHH